MTQEITEELQVNKNKLPKYQETYYRAMVRVCDFFSKNWTGWDIMFCGLILIYFLIYSLILNKFDLSTKDLSIHKTPWLVASIPALFALFIINLIFFTKKINQISKKYKSKLSIN